MPSGQESSSMQPCYLTQGLTVSGQSSCCYGAPGCTAAPLSQKTSESCLDGSSGQDPRQESNSEPNSKAMRLSLSSDASLQDLYLLLRAFSEGGYDVSVSVQATPSKESALSLSDTAEPYGFLTKVSYHTESVIYLDAVTQHLRSTTPSSKRRGSLGKLQEGRQ